MKTMWDASTPPAQAPGGPWDAAAGYIGGDTPHVWTLADWRARGSLPKLPIWVQSGPVATHGRAEAFAALSQLYTIGAPRGITVALDLETSDTPATDQYVTGFGRVMAWAGFHVWCYGSRSTIGNVPPLDGRWVADFTGTPHHAAVPAERATQWQAGPVVDSSVIRWWQWRRRLWR